MVLFYCFKCSVGIVSCLSCVYVRRFFCYFLVCVFSVVVIYFGLCWSYYLSLYWMSLMIACVLMFLLNISCPFSIFFVFRV